MIDGNLPVYTVSLYSSSGPVNCEMVCVCVCLKKKRWRVKSQVFLIWCAFLALSANSFWFDVLFSSSQPSWVLVRVFFVCLLAFNIKFHFLFFHLWLSNIAVLSLKKPFLVSIMHAFLAGVVEFWMSRRRASQENQLCYSLLFSVVQARTFSSRTAENGKCRNVRLKMRRSLKLPLF